MREALAHAFDFEWSNKKLFYGAYTRARSYFNNSELEAKGVPPLHERALLQALSDKFPGSVPPEALTTPLEAWLHCARWQCSELISRPGQEDGTFWDVSDHCPLTFEIRDANLEGQN